MATKISEHSFTILAGHDEYLYFDVFDRKTELPINLDKHKISLYLTDYNDMGNSVLIKNNVEDCSECYITDTNENNKTSHSKIGKWTINIIVRFKRLLRLSKYVKNRIVIKLSSQDTQGLDGLYVCQLHLKDEKGSSYFPPLFQTLVRVQGKVYDVIL